MATPDQFRASIPDPYQILGLTLKPLSIGRYRLLRRFGCSFVSDETASAHAEDLIIGVLVCSMRVDEFTAWANSPNFAKDIRRWSRSISPFPFLGRLPIIGKWWRAKFSFDLWEKFQLFSQYIAEHSKIPLYWEEESSNSSSGSHWSHNIEVSLRKEMNWTTEEVNEAPLSKAIADFFKLCETQGSIRLMNEWEIAEIERQEKKARLASGL